MASKPDKAELILTQEQQDQLTTITENQSDPIPLQLLIELRSKGLSYSQVGKIAGAQKNQIKNQLKDLLAEVNE